MKLRKSYVVVDFNPEGNTRWDPLISSLNRVTGINWELYGETLKDNSAKTRYIHYFRIAWKLFRNRDHVADILSNQQFYGLIYAFYCRVFKVKKQTNIYILSFIYNDKKGIAGWLYKKFIQFIVHSDYIDKLLVHSRTEVKYYSEKLGIDQNKLAFCVLGVTDDSVDYNIHDGSTLDEPFVLSVGNSNRDFNFIKTALKGKKYRVEMYSDKLNSEQDDNILTSPGLSVQDYYKRLASCFCMVIALEDPNISSGQLVLLQSCAFGKPVIITVSNGCIDYVFDGASIAIRKDVTELQKAIDSLFSNKEKYQELCVASRNLFDQFFSLGSMGNRIGDIINRSREIECERQN